MFKKAALLVGIFSVGCAIGQMAGPFIVPPARAGTNPTAWEYTCIYGQYEPFAAQYQREFVDNMNRLGAAGWELAGVGSAGGAGGLDRFCFKRALPAGAAAPVSAHSSTSTTSKAGTVP